jgi:hypothetical protein
MPGYILARVKCNVRKSEHAHASSAIIDYRYSPNKFLLHNPAAFLQ